MSTSVLSFIQAQFVRYGMAIILVFGCFGNVYAVFFFIRQRKNVCALFLLSAAFMNILYLIFNIPINVYSYEFGDPSRYSMTLCKLRYYIFHVWGQMSRYFILLACIDRYALTHMSANIRLLIGPRLARRLIVIVTLFWHVFPLHILIMTTIKNGQCGYFDLYYILNSIYMLIFVCLVPPISMSVFGYLAFRNMHRLHTRVQPSSPGMTNDAIAIHRQDQNLLRMVLAEVIMYLMTMSIYPVIICELAVTNAIGMNKSLQQTQIESFILFMAQFLIYINTSAPFYTYMTVSKTFRHDFKETLRLCIRRTP
ncbi:unnamed protein product [Adineta ricciae]|uniref:G-protein coupled receptors family 1 profile domain-containing protein n=1 Tax=Adineta ricciae TaxID=249248 RepID=A0A815FNF7_ADIRI|nr:unnamed protein product [Adineta ricciae]CAF1630979.1 unnamed protein product [Adineta ricciae]